MQFESSPRDCLNEVDLWTLQLLQDDTGFSRRDLLDQSAMQVIQCRPFAEVDRFGKRQPIELFQMMTEDRIDLGQF